MIYICIPAHNEEQTVGVVLWKIRQVMAEFPRDYQLLVADDASTDKTSEVLTPYARVLPLTVVRTDTRRGYAASLEMLLREAVRRSEYPKRDVIVTLQADFSQEPEELVPMIKMMEAGADIVVGESTLPPDTMWKIRWSRGIAAKLLGRKSVPAGVRDPFTGYRAYRVFTVKKAMDERAGGRLLQHDGWAANAELLAASAPHARRIETLDVTVRPHRLQRPSRLHPWPALKNVWAYARKAKPEIEVASVHELDESVASGAVSRRNDVAAVRERMSERTDSQGNRTPHGDRQPYNARPERGRNDRQGRDRSSQRAQADNGRAGNGERPRSGERPRNGDRPRKGDRAQVEARNTAPRESKPRENRESRGRRNGNRQTSEIVAQDAAIPPVSEVQDSPELIAADAVPSGDAGHAGAETKRRRRRGRRSRGGAKRNAAGTAGDAADTQVTGEQMPEPFHAAPADAADIDTQDDGAQSESTGDGTPAKKRRRGRRGGRGRRRSGSERAAQDTVGDGTLEQQGAVDVESHRMVVEIREHHEPAQAPMSGGDIHES